MSDVLTLAPPVQEQRLPLFQVGETVYDMPASPPLGVAVRYLERSLRGAGLIAEMALLEELLGEEAYRVLLDQSVPQEDLRTLINAAEKHVLGPLERPGNSPSGSERSPG